MEAESRNVLSPQLYPARLVSRVLFTLFFTRCTVHGKKNIPPPGRTYILALNHSSLADPPLVWAFYPDPVYFLAKQELHDIPIFGWGLDRAGVIPVRREKAGLNLSAIRTSLRYLKELGRNLAVFVEGTRSVDGTIGEGKHGCAMLALKSEAPVVPAFIEGTHDVLPRGKIVPRFSNKIAIHIGRPLTFAAAAPTSDRRTRLEEVTTQIVSAIDALNPKRPAPDRPEEPACPSGGS